MPQEISLFTDQAPLNLLSLLLNLAIGVLLAIALRIHFRRFGSTLSNRDEFAQVFPFVLLTTVLIISIVKSSLALSLGLVGALSIVRFRTPIKEPEELAYLFMAIAMGLGLGANQTIPTVVASIVILSVMALIGRYGQDTASTNVYLSIDCRDKNGSNEDFLKKTSEIIQKHTLNCDLRRFDIREGSVESTYFLDIASNDNLNALISELSEYFPEAGITFLDQNQLPSV